MNESMAFLREQKRIVVNRGKIGKMKSDCEEFIRVMRQRLEEDATLLAVMDENETQVLKTAFEEADAWYESVRNAIVRFDDFAARFKALRALAHEPQVRAELTIHKGNALRRMNETLGEVELTLVENATKVAKWKIERLSELFNETREWFETKAQGTQEKILPAAIEQRRVELEAWYNFTTGRSDRDSHENPPPDSINDL
jgi:translation elongation factor EF-G